MPRPPGRGYRRRSRDAAGYERVSVMITKGDPMPKLSKDTAQDVQDAGPAVDRGGDLDDTTVNFVTIRHSHSLAPLLRGLPADSCQCPHWGYVLAGKITVSYGARDETYETGDAFYMPPGHIPAAEAGTEFIQFSPREQLAVTIAAIQANARDAGRPN
jgi:hypothetical protein